MYRSIVAKLRCDAQLVVAGGEAGGDKHQKTSGLINHKVGEFCLSFGIYIREIDTIICVGACNLEVRTFNLGILAFGKGAIGFACAEVGNTEDCHWAGLLAKKFYFGLRDCLP